MKREVWLVAQELHNDQRLEKQTVPNARHTLLNSLLHVGMTSNDCPWLCGWVCAYSTTLWSAYIAQQTLLQVMSAPPRSNLVLWFGLNPTHLAAFSTHCRNRSTIESRTSVHYPTSHHKQSHIAPHVLLRFHFLIVLTTVVPAKSTRVSSFVE